MMLGLATSLTTPPVLAAPGATTPLFVIGPTTVITSATRIQGTAG